jgi:hypothetical protein
VSKALKECGGSVYWICLAQDRDHLHALVYMAMKRGSVNGTVKCILILYFSILLH